MLFWSLPVALQPSSGLVGTAAGYGFLLIPARYILTNSLELWKADVAGSGMGLVGGLDESRKEGFGFENEETAQDI